MRIDALLPQLLVELPGCPESLVASALVRACIEFCRNSEAWELTLDPITLVEGEHTYDLGSPAGAQLVTIKNVWVGANALRPVTQADLQRVLPDWQSALGNEPAFYMGTPDWLSVRVYPIPSSPVDTPMVVRAVFAPWLSARSLPDAIATRYFETLCAGAKATLMLVPQRAWSNPQLAVVYATQFAEGITNARNEALHNRAQGTVSVQPRRFGY